MDYFTKVWHFNISAEVVNKIKSHNFDPYFSINNLYSAGIKGLETGRAYKINVGRTNVFKFDQYTLCSTENYKLKSVSNAKHGKLTDNGNGTYSYVPDANFTQDSFDLVYEVTIGGKTYTRTLVVKLAPNYNYIETVTYGADESMRKKSVQDAISQLVREDNVLSSGTVKNFSSATATGDNLVHFKATVVFPFTKNVTFMVFGDDKTLLKIGDQSAYTNQYIANVNAAKNLPDNKLTLSVKEGEPIKVDAYCFNNGGNGSLSLKYSTDNGETYQDIPSGYCYSYDASKADIESSKPELNVYPAYADFTNKYLNAWYSSNSLRTLASSVECLDNNGEQVKLVDGADINAVIDGNLSTNCHTAWRGTITPYPHNYYISFAEKASFNEIKFSFMNDAFADYEIYTSEDGVDYKLLTEGTNTKTGTTSFSVLFDTSVTTKYIKLVVKSQVAGKAFYNLREIEFLKTLNLGLDYNAYSSDSALLSYSSEWQTVLGNYVNGQVKHTTDGKVRFYVTGTDFMLYSTNAESRITIDGQTYTIKENRSDYSPSFIIDGLSEGRHLIEIDAKDFNLDMIKTSGYITNVESSTPPPADDPSNNPSDNPSGNPSGPSDNPSDNPSDTPSDNPTGDSQKKGCSGDFYGGFAGVLAVAVMGAFITVKRSRKKSS